MTNLFWLLVICDWLFIISKKGGAMRKQMILILAATACVLLMSCRHEPERRYDLKGKIVSVNKGNKEVTIAHEEVKGLMDAMTMPFTVKDDWALSVLAPGQSVEATLVISGDNSWIEGLRISKTEAIPGAAPSVIDPKIGEEVPDFTLLNQNNKPIHISQYRGKPLLLTFIYTRCPLPDFCPRTSKNFADINRELQALPATAIKPHLLTVSFDTEFDTPAVLQDYAKRYMVPVNYQAWEFATGSPEEIKKITGYFGLTYWKESGQITHNLVTALIGPDGKLLRLYKGKDWVPKEVLAEFKHE
jgi:protein SCO1